MYWLILGMLCVMFAVTMLLLWQKWAAPWPQIEQLVSQIARGERPSTFLINGGPDPQRVGLVLETISAHQQELERRHDVRLVVSDQDFHWRARIFMSAA